MRQAIENLLYDIGPVGATLCLCACIVLVKAVAGKAERIVVKHAKPKARK